MLEALTSFGPFIGIATVVGMILWAAHWLLIKRHPELGNERKFPRQLIMLGLTLLGLLASVLVLPISDNSRNQLMGLIGILISGILFVLATISVEYLSVGYLIQRSKLKHGNLSLCLIITALTTL